MRTWRERPSGGTLDTYSEKDFTRATPSRCFFFFNRAFSSSRTPCFPNESATFTFLQWAAEKLLCRGGFLSTSTKAQLQRVIVHLSQISFLCNCLSTLRNTLSGGWEITGIYVVVQHWAWQRYNKPDKVDIHRMKPIKRIRYSEWQQAPMGFTLTNIPRQPQWSYIYIKISKYLILLDAQSSPCCTSIRIGWLKKRKSRKAYSAFLQLMFPPFFFFSVSRFERLDFGPWQRVTFFLSRIQCTHWTQTHSLSCMSTHTWKTFCSLYMICIACMSLNHELKYLIGPQLRTIRLSPWCLIT